jgi:hypothetical protein
VLAPQIGDEAARRHDESLGEGQRPDQRTDALASHRERPPLVVDDLDGAEDTHLHAATVASVTSHGQRELSGVSACGTTLSV